MVDQLDEKVYTKMDVTVNFFLLIILIISSFTQKQYNTDDTFCKVTVLVFGEIMSRDNVKISVPLSRFIVKTRKCLTDSHVSEVWKLRDQCEEKWTLSRRTLIRRGSLHLYPSIEGFFHRLDTFGIR